MKPVRNYKAKDVEMLITAATITESAITHQEFLQSKRAAWNDTFFQDFATKIDTVIEEYLGRDNAKALRKATQEVLAIQTPALVDLAEFKVQVDADFNSDPLLKKEILTTLGYNSFYTEAKKKDQESTISLLYQFKKNLTTDLRATITNKGIDAALLVKITSYADQLKNKNITQEGKKSARKELTEEAINNFNAIYEQASAIAKIATKFFKGDPTVQEQFSFSKVKNKINNK